MCMTIRNINFFDEVDEVEERYEFEDSEGNWCYVEDGIAYIEEDDRPIGLYNDDEDYYLFGYDAIIPGRTEFEFYVNLTKETIQPFIKDIVKIEICDCCMGSWDYNLPNEAGICHCWCSSCGKRHIDCKYSC